MDQEAPKGREASAGNKTIIPAVVTIVASLVLVASFFLPFATAVGDYREYLESVPDELFDETLGVTASEITDVSLFEYAEIYGGLAANGWGDSWMIIAATIASVAVFSVIALLFALLRKATPTIVFVILAFAVVQVFIGGVGDVGSLSTSSYEAGIAHITYPAASLVAIAGSIWLFVVKFKAKRQ